MGNPTAAMLVIGDEILSGRTRDANMYFLAGKLADAGINLSEVRVIADDHTAIVSAVQDLNARFDHVFTSGGIGPTHDDITADAIAAAFATPIDIRADAREILTAYYQKTGTDLNAPRLRMARIPDGAVLIENPISAAPGFSLGRVHVMAGVPAIFQAMVASLLPTLTGGLPMISRNLRLNIPEGEIAQRLGQVAQAFPKVSMGSYPFIQNGLYGSNVVLRATDAALLDTACTQLKALFPEAIEQ